MGVLDFNTASIPAAPSISERASRPFQGIRNGNGVDRADRPKAKLWLNLGYDVNGKFVNLPIGTPLDTMEPTDVRGQNPDWIKLQTARNNLLKALQAYGAQLAPGQEVEIPNLVIKLRRVNDELAVAEEDNEYAVDLVSLLSGAPTLKAAE